MRQPVYFISHGGGPWPWMPDPANNYAALTTALRGIPAALPQPPRAILMISAHWITRDRLKITSHPQPGMVYDYHGFPADTYELHYPAPGSPRLSARLKDLLSAKNIPISEDSRRGYDHGAFVPAYIMYPKAQIPMVQLSIEAGFDPSWHHALGAALQPLRDENILIVGSGLSFHNLRSFGPAAREPSALFDAWLQEALVDTTPDQRQDHLRHWDDAPAARICHPMEDHLTPLFVADGAAGKDTASCFHHETEFFGGLTISSFRFG
ncbi:class III extradiol ring-cleavage dioxygenase [Castellaniella sp.]|uniref:DODA-type extradiol aromatic ring-opening family dioxygenase n=1 Tax=Castellaniella sp. TaxID=1955812 RepID=UPI002AFFEDFB|nr:class III extradiol ring-cleavage dioxygenase [Castellaniella sp.]